MRLVNESNLQQAEHAGVLVDLMPGKSESVAVNTLSSEETVGLVHEDRVVDGYRKFDVARMPWALGLVQVACKAPTHDVVSSIPPFAPRPGSTERVW